MLPTLFNSTTIPILEKVIGFSEARHNVLAGNIANLDTPGYRAKDLSPALFQSQLKEAIETRHQQAAEPGGANPLGGTAADSEDPFAGVRETMKSLVYHDQSDNDLERQVAELTKNQMQYNLAVTIMTNQFRLLQSAISEQA
ncbi:MAG TPA: flagellar basal body rod protein FlgB [Pirellulales bacterium]|jgi:flagellar basal-body rod protein FlgB|nr:flagellar basal body rod protein FlgB [Pirellulales bacterium]